MKRPSPISPLSLRARIIFGVLLAVVVSLWVTTLSIGHYLRRDMEATISAQQFSAVSLIGREVDRSVRERLRAIETLADGLTPGLMADSSALQQHLEQQVVGKVLFNWGVMVLDARGVALASVPAALERAGTDYGDRDFVRQALGGGRTAISEPLTGTRTGQPVITMAAPVRDARGAVAGLLLGVTNLARRNFLDEISEARYGRTGDFFVTAPRSRMFVASSDKRRVMKAGPPPGVNPVYDAYIDGREGSGIALSSRGVVELSSSVRIPSTGWLMQSVLPVEEAFAPVEAIEHRLLAISVLLTVLAGTVAAFWLRRELAPLAEAATLIARMRDGLSPRRPLPVRRGDEIGELASAFNGLLGTIEAGEARAAEHIANERLRKIVARVPGVVFQYRREANGDGSFPFASDAVQEIFGVTPDQIRDSALPVREMLHPGDADRFFESLRRSGEQLSPWRVEYRARTADGTVKWLLVDAVPEPGEDGAVVWYGAITDISAAKSMEQALRIAAVTFESQEGIIITDARGVIVRVNHAFTDMTGYEEVEAIGRTPALLRSGRHDQGFYRAMWRALEQDGFWRGELWNRRKNGELYAEWATISAVRDADGNVTHYVGTFTDITDHKHAEEQIRRLAFYDPLTNLPNRRLFFDRLDQALAASARSNCHGALMFIDLDQFKSLNDREGHLLGDALLSEVARRILLCVRASDTVARLGGDEFVVMLQDLAATPEGPAGAIQQACAVAEKIREALGEPYSLVRGEAPPVPHQCTASIGMTLFRGDTPGREELLRRADVAMYAAKAGGRNAVRFYESPACGATAAVP